jgi:hypothetical protein
MCLVIAACADKSVSPEQGKGMADAEKRSGLDQVLDTVGDPQLNKLQSMAGKSREELATLGLEYTKPTGQWFKGNGFNLVFAYSSGTQKPGSQVSIVLNGPVAERSIRFQLTERGTEYKRAGVIAEKTVHPQDSEAARPAFQLNLPVNKEDVHYLLSTEILTADGRVEDIFLADYYIPPQTINAKLSAESISTGANSTTVTLYNAGPTTLRFGAGYGLQRKTADEWFEIPDERAVPSIAYGLKPGDERKDEFRFPKTLGPGTYRVVLALQADGTEKKATLAAEFELR